MLEPGQSSVVAHRLTDAAFVERAARRRPPGGHLLRDRSVSPLVDLSGRRRTRHDGPGGPAARAPVAPARPVR